MEFSRVAGAQYRWRRDEVDLITYYIDLVQQMIRLHERSQKCTSVLYWMTGIVLIVLNMLTTSFNIFTKNAEREKCFSESDWVFVMDMLQVALSVLQGVVLFINPSATAQKNKHYVNEFQFLLITLQTEKSKHRHSMTFHAFITPIEMRFHRLNGHLNTVPAIVRNMSPSSEEDSPYRSRRVNEFDFPPASDSEEETDAGRSLSVQYYPYKPSFPSASPGRDPGGNILVAHAVPQTVAQTQGRQSYRPGTA